MNEESISERVRNRSDERFQNLIREGVGVYWF